MGNVGVESKLPSAAVSLGDTTCTYKFEVEGGPAGIKEGPNSSSTVLYNQAGTKSGDAIPYYSHLEQRSWDGGRGGEDFSDDNTKTFDQNAWTLTPGKFHPSLLRQYATGIRTVDEFQRNKSFIWFPLYGDTLYLDTLFAAGASQSVDKAYIWLRKVGNPGPLTFNLCADSSGALSTVLQTVTVVTDDVPSMLSVRKPLDWSGTQALTATTVYHLEVIGSTPASSVNHWEVGVGCELGATDIPSRYSSDGSTFYSIGAKMFYRVVPVEVAKKWRFFTLEGALYAVDEKADGSASVLYINGDRGTCASNSGTLTLCNDGSTPARSWTVNQWAGYRVTIIAGPGFGEDRLILSNTATALTVDRAWNTTQTTASRYVIYGGPKWQPVTIGTTALSGVVTGVTVANSIAYFAQGASVYILGMQNNATTGAHTGRAESSYADILATVPSDTDLNIWRGLFASSAVSAAPKVAWNTSLTFGTAINVGDPSYRMTNITEYNSSPIVFKVNGTWTINGSKASRLPVGTDAIQSLTNGVGCVSKDIFLYYSWAHSVERFYGATQDDLGPWRGPGMPLDRRGPVAHMTSAIANIYCSLDAGANGVSSILAWNGKGWHEVVRGDEIGRSITFTYWQPNQGGNPILWYSYGGEIAFMKFPKYTLDPLKDSNVRFEHEGYVDTAFFDMGLTQLPKFFKDVDLITSNVGGGDNISIYYQMDQEVDSSVWEKAGTIYESPVDTVLVDEGNVRKLRYRFIINSNDLTVPPIVEASVVKVYGRAPAKRVWSIRVKGGGVTRNGKIVKGKKLSEMYAWFWKKSQESGGVLMKSIFPGADDIWVLVEPPSLIRQSLNSIVSLWGGTIILTLRES
jgi:hypothetical protein